MVFYIALTRHRFRYHSACGCPLPCKARERGSDEGFFLFQPPASNLPPEEAFAIFRYHVVSSPARAPRYKETARESTGHTRRHTRKNTPGPSGQKREKTQGQGQGRPTRGVAAQAPDVLQARRSGPRGAHHADSGPHWLWCDHDDEQDGGLRQIHPHHAGRPLQGARSRSQPREKRRRAHCGH